MLRYVFTHPFLCVLMFVCVHVCTRVFMFAHVCARVRAGVFAHVRVNVCTPCVCVLVRVCVCVGVCLCYRVSIHLMYQHHLLSSITSSAAVPLLQAALTQLCMEQDHKPMLTHTAAC